MVKLVKGMINLDGMGGNKFFKNIKRLIFL